MWTVEPEQIWKKPRKHGISGFMRLKNEAEFLDRAIGSHIDGLDELIIVYNDCSDETPEICAGWEKRFPEKIKLIEYEPKVVPIGTPESLEIDPRSPNCIANYYNFALSLTNYKIVVKVDGDHIAVKGRFRRIADRVRRKLPPKRRYPIYGLNITFDEIGRIAIYNLYDFSPQFTGSRASKKGPPPFTSGDHAFYHVDKSCWHTVDPIEGFEVMDLGDKPRFEGVPMTYAFFHMKGVKQDRGTGNWGRQNREGKHLRASWVQNVLSTDPSNLASLEAKRRHNPEYFRGANLANELASVLPDAEVRPFFEENAPVLNMRERAADIWYRLAYP